MLSHAIWNLFLSTLLKQNIFIFIYLLLLLLLLFYFIYYYYYYYFFFFFWGGGGFASIAPPRNLPLKLNQPLDNNVGACVFVK